MIRRPPRSTPLYSSAASDVYKRQVHEFVRLAEQYGLPRVATVQNAYCLLNRTVENGLDETMHRLGVSLLAYSPLAFGLLTGKYDASGIEGPDAPKQARIGKFESVRKQRWGR